MGDTELYSPRSSTLVLTEHTTQYCIHTNLVVLDVLPWRPLMLPMALWALALAYINLVLFTTPLNSRK